MNIKQFSWLLFDADETLFHFDAFAGLRALFANYQIDFSRDDFIQYQTVNKPLWVAYQDGHIDAQTLQQNRFSQWADNIGCSTQELNQGFLQAMADICQPMCGVVELLEQAKEYAELAIITNGFTELQAVRLQKTGLDKYFSHVVISEQVGAAKPDKKIFRHAQSLMGEVEPEQVLMVGDNLHSDIIGGQQAGMQTCWLNHHGALTEQGIEPTLQVRNISQLHQWLFSNR
ncbi:dUMP phosphatase [Shewanella maritima]|uniref:dUMP phosphatase n=1 Tax=Shewanella maritima TaxID=2520507 RepID=A0A411PIS5_9GAMM|nr:pyrimidine 5'-nucleotidase [Shewanella maritima]QBF83443.1 dUMP phosphatase [Shewanella maritima]